MDDRERTRKKINSSNGADMLWTLVKMASTSSVVGYTGTVGVTAGAHVFELFTAIFTDPTRPRWPMEEERSLAHIEFEM